MAGESQQVPEARPDPSVMATEAIDRAIRAERDYQTALHQLIDAKNEATNQRLTDLEQRLDREFHEHLEQVRHENALAFVNSDRAIAAALQSQEKAVDKAEAANEKRFESVNEFRAQLNDQAATFISRPEYQAGQYALTEKIAAIEKVQDREGGRSSGLNAGWLFVASAIPLAVSVILAVLALTR